MTILNATALPYPVALIANVINKDVVDLVFEMLGLPADVPGIRTLVQIAAPTLLVAMSDACPGVFLGQEASVRACAELANDATFRDLLEPRLPQISGILLRLKELTPSGTT